jgi:hypothetical protein
MTSAEHRIKIDVFVHVNQSIQNQRSTASLDTNSDDRRITNERGKRNMEMLYFRQNTANVSDACTRSNWTFYQQKKAKIERYLNGDDIGCSAHGEHTPLSSFRSRVGAWIQHENEPIHISQLHQSNQTIFSVFQIKSVN